MDNNNNIDLKNLLSNKNDLYSETIDELMEYLENDQNILFEQEFLEKILNNLIQSNRKHKFI